MGLLISKAKKHDKVAFQQLIEQHEKAMYQIAKSILKNDDDVADAMQETIMKCWDEIDTLKNDRYFKTWLIRILINNCNAIFRQRMRSIEEDGIPEVWVHFMEAVVKSNVKVSDISGDAEFRSLNFTTAFLD